MNKTTIAGIAGVVIVLVGIGAYFLMKAPSSTPVPQNEVTVPLVVDEQTPAEEVKVEDKTKTVIGTSVGGREIVAYHYGTGDKQVLFVAGIHGGYEWNTVILARDLMDYLQKTPDAIPAGVEVTVIPVVNPDGLSKVATTTAQFAANDISASQTAQVAGRYNANNVDLNRNFDCDWKTSGVWRNTPVSGGATAFSEPESKAMKAYVESTKPTAVVVWYSSVGGVYPSSCGSDVLAETATLTSLYAKASGYPAYKTFNYYETTGDMVNWLAKQKIPGISVLLTTHTDAEWGKNKAGITALLQHYSQ